MAIDTRIDRQAVRLARLGEEPSDLAYWQSLSLQDRLSSLEILRSRLHPALQYMESKNLNFSQDFLDFIEAFNKYEVRYLVIGGYAVTLHGYVRYTGDIDFWIETEADNAKKVMAALEEFGFGNIDLSEADFLHPDRVVQLGRVPNRIDIIMGLEEMDFADCYAKKVEVELAEGIKLDFIDLESLIKAKRIAGRDKDLLDIKNLQ